MTTVKRNGCRGGIDRVGLILWAGPRAVGGEILDTVGWKDLGYGIKSTPART